ncbi:mitotic spindle assembly checkpoint protein MAD1-like [Teleopsis dalmanni]|uniref:mitotic spindle assembly checkpoint protein MAD1-like n=1 Tax=Teleopsis dalmanni TaxID=139649 RepID=UPI0018CD437A|nr:mitotic spindle assembly checkpoint protein MAD1-like [Teleopsis dalmanni]
MSEFIVTILKLKEMFIQKLQLEEKQELIREIESWQRQIDIMQNIIICCGLNINRSKTKKVKKLTEAEQSPARPWETRRLKAELIYLKVSKLEDVDFGKFKSKIQDAETHLQAVRKSEQAAEQDLVRMQRVLNDLKQYSEDIIQKLQKAKDDIETEARQMKNCMTNELEEYRLHTDKLSMELQLLTNEMSDLESKIVSYGDWKKITKNNHACLSSFPDMEKEVEFLRGKNKNLHELIRDNLLLEEQVYGLKTQLKIKDPEDTLSKSEAEAPEEIFNENINNKNYNEKESAEDELLGISARQSVHS